MRIATLLCFSLFPFLAVTSQQTIDVNKDGHNIGTLFYAVGGEPYVNAKFVSLVDGSPFFKTEWTTGIVTSTQGGIYKEVPVKLNLLENQIHFQDASGKEFIASTAIKEIELMDNTANKRLRFINAVAFPALKNLKPKWYLSLFSDKVWLLKDYQKTMIEQKPYGSATTEQRIVTKEAFYIVHNNTVSRVKAIKEVQALLADQKEPLETFIKNQNSSLPLDEKLTQIIAHYNSLIK